MVLALGLILVIFSPMVVGYCLLMRDKINFGAGICLIFIVSAYGWFAFGIGVKVLTKSNYMTTDHSQFIETLWTPSVIIAFSLLMIACMACCFCFIITLIRMYFRSLKVVVPSVMVISVATKQTDFTIEIRDPATADPIAKV